MDVQTATPGDSVPTLRVPVFLIRLKKVAETCADQAELRLREAISSSLA